MMSTAATPADRAEPETLEFPGRDAEDAKVRALLAAHRAGDPSALADLLARYQDRLFAVCLRMVNDPELARDLTQDALVKVIQGLDQFTGASKLSTWTIRVTMNVCLTHMRKAKLRRHASLDAPMGRGEGSSLGAALADEGMASSAERLAERERTDALYAALARLEPAQRAMLILRDMQGLDYRTIADILGVPEGTVKSRLFRARAALRDEIESGEQTGASDA